MIRSDIISWKSLVLRLAAIYNLVWGSWVILFPKQFFIWTQMEVPEELMIWQGLGMVIGVYGLGYWWSSYDTIRHWPIIAIGFIGKILGPVGFLFNYFNGDVSGSFAYTLITNDFIWWIPFYLILQEAHAQGWPLRDNTTKHI